MELASHRLKDVEWKYPPRILGLWLGALGYTLKLKSHAIGSLGHGWSSPMTPSKGKGCKMEMDTNP